MRMLAYVVSADAVYDYVRIGESTAVEGLKKFVSNVIMISEGEYLRKPNSDGMQRLLQMGEAHGFPGKMGSIDCMHWQWKNCPKAWKRIFMSDWSPVFDDVRQGRAPEVNYTINRNNYNMGYYLTYGIYAEWATFVKTIPRPQDGPARFWDKEDLGRIMRACIIIHNMIVEGERDTYATQFGPLPTYDDATNGLSQPNSGEEYLVPYETYIQNSMQMRDRRAHRQLQNDLVEHISHFYENR
ncbi:uncharacterized protein LOC141665471 [Apium graveolens]|uniref:uncharacterized protein LOC141665471 n=1 Tax=Apium graveolens TaxID=4045 RepID=UPI003D7BF86E